jgi:tetratricopeptide (TPR) repeat protein
LKLYGDFYEGYVELAKVLHLRGQFNESEHTINKAIRLDKSRGTAYYIKGDINLAQNQRNVAIKNYRDCLAADSLFHNARIKLALLELNPKKDAAPVLNHLKKVLHTILFGRAHCYSEVFLDMGRTKNNPYAT